MNDHQRLRSRIRLFTWLFIVGLILSGATAIPLEREVEWLVQRTGAEHRIEHQGGDGAPAWALWLVSVRGALAEVAAEHSFLFYGTDWLAFGHFVIAIAFAGALRNPVRNRWLFRFGMIACALVIPYALVLGAVRNIPIWWRLIDCSFGVAGFLPLWLCHTWAQRIERNCALSGGNA